MKSLAHVPTKRLGGSGDVPESSVMRRAPHPLPASATPHTHNTHNIMAPSPVETLFLSLAAAGRISGMTRAGAEDAILRVKNDERAKRGQPKQGLAPAIVKRRKAEAQAAAARAKAAAAAAEKRRKEEAKQWKKDAPKRKRQAKQRAQIDKKRRAQELKELKERAKAPPSALNLFTKDYMGSHPGSKLPEASKAWSALPQEQKDEWKAKSQAGKEERAKRLGLIAAVKVAEQRHKCTVASRMRENGDRCGHHIEYVANSSWESKSTSQRLQLAEKEPQARARASAFAVDAIAKRDLKRAQQHERNLKADRKRKGERKAREKAAAEAAKAAGTPPPPQAQRTKLPSYAEDSDSESEYMVRF